jgi:S-adenosylhomocysteine hydrolase
VIPIDTMLKDPALAPQGRRRVDFAAGRMPVLAAVGAALARTRPLRGMRTVAHLAAVGATLGPGVHPVPAAIEGRVARHKLAALGVRCDDLTAAQEDDLRDWRIGS